MSEPITIERRFRGPPDSAHGGYVSGRLSAFVDGPTEVTLRKPPPLDRPLAVVRSGEGVALLDGDTLVAEGGPATFDRDVPEAVSPDTASAASRAYPGLDKHIFPQCFACGPQRDEGDGLRIFPGWLDGRKVVAAPWTPDPSLAGADGELGPEFVWAALDCPGAWALFDEAGNERAIVLGRLTAHVLTPVRAGERCVVIGWPLGEDGRKLYAGTALFGEDGDLRACARATWVRLD